MKNIKFDLDIRKSISTYAHNSNGMTGGSSGDSGVLPDPSYSCGDVRVTRSANEHNDIMVKCQPF